MVNGIDQQFLSTMQKTQTAVDSMERVDAQRSFDQELEQTVSAHGKKEVKDEKLWDTCVEFESLFINQMYSAMRKTVHKGEMIHGGAAEEIFEDFLYDEYAKMTAEHSRMGLASMLYRQLV